MTALVLLFLTAATPLPAQAPPEETGAAITPAEMRRHIEIIADDSMQGRDTPSPGLERAARYVAAEFERLGLRPAGTDGGYEQRWGLSRWVPDTAASRIELAGPGWRKEVRLGVDARYVGGSVDGRELRGETVLLDDSAPDDPASEGEARDRVALLPVDYSGPLPSRLQERVDRLAAAARAVLILSNQDSPTFATRLRGAAQPRWSPDFRMHDDGAPVLELHRRALDSGMLGGGEQATVRLERKYLSRATAPNLAGIVEGTDPALRGEYVAITAHVDGVGIRPGARDSINNGADDNASGLAALLEVAEAFSAPGARPRRSLLFLVPSGEEKGLWGSAHFVAHPTVPLDRIVAVLNLDLIGRNWTDSVIVVGPEFSTLGETLRRVGEARPELRMAPIRDRWPEERIFYRSDHYHFARRGVPILFFTSGTHPDYHQPTDSPDRVDAEKASRVARLLYHVARDVADDPERPRWSPESYRRIVQETRP
ncbi:MAG TPA: M20/M25/M40 family metallo-hydrolase [Gemmatimonadales bacterium]|nr:M20/M25/M40 family metallo-hydrolase [Gemmatimonadales bacterium]